MIDMLDGEQKAASEHHLAEPSDLGDERICMRRFGKRLLRGGGDDGGRERDGETGHDVLSFLLF